VCGSTTLVYSNYAYEIEIRGQRSTRSRHANTLSVYQALMVS